MIWKKIIWWQFLPDFFHTYSLLSDLNIWISITSWESRFISWPPSSHNIIIFVMSSLGNLLRICPVDLLDFCRFGVWQFSQMQSFQSRYSHVFVVDNKCLMFISGFRSLTCNWVFRRIVQKITDAVNCSISSISSSLHTFFLEIGYYGHYYLVSPCLLQELF
jgi:hypothetical protein